MALENAIVTNWHRSCNAGPIAINMQETPKNVRGTTRLRVKGILLTMLGAFLFSLLPIWVRSVEAYSPLNITFYRALFGSLTLILIMRTFSHKKKPLSSKKFQKEEWLLLAGLGLAMCGSSVFYFFGILHTSVAKAVLLNYTAPIYVAIFAPWVLKEKSSGLTWLAISIGLAGIVLIADPRKLIQAGSEEFIGIVSSLASGFSFSGIFLIGRKLSGRLTAVAETMWGSLVMALVMVPWAFVALDGLFLKNLPFLILVGTISMAIPFTLFYHAQNFISAQVSSTAALFEPVCGVTIGYFVYHEHLASTGIIGGICVLMSIILVSRAESRCGS